MSTHKFPDMWVDPEDDPREGGPSLGDQRATLNEYLRSQRLTKCSGLDAADLARRSVEPSTMSLRELLVHMVEEYARHNGHADLARADRREGRAVAVEVGDAVIH